MNLEALCAESIPAICQIGQEIWLKSRDLDAVQIKEKAAGDIATDIDLWAENALRERLGELLPGAQFMGEETGGVLSDEPTWIVDPIDGTANFARGYPQWSVSVALAMDRQPVLGIIADPNRQEYFYATRGQGAWLQGRDGVRQLFCAVRQELLNATVSTVFPKPQSTWMSAYMQEFERVIRASGQVRRSGSMALELAYVAAGRADAFWERGMQAWDAAAGWVLIQEAGGSVVAMDDQPVLASQFLAAGSSVMLPRLIEVLRLDAIEK
jgi:myo-inositol-1(or 4)-monophosphatase